MAARVRSLRGSLAIWLVVCAGAADPCDVPPARLNDDYCDCADGSDEPGTSACASLGAQYYCANRGFRAQYVRASVVNDGICDCCDGSDEHASSAGCVSNCLEAGASARAAAAERVSAVSAGLEKAKRFAEQDAVKRQAWGQELATLQSSLAENKAAQEAVEARKKVAEDKENVLREAYLKKKAEEDAVKAAEQAKRTAAEEAARAEAASLTESGACVSWRQTGGCSGHGEREAAQDSPCLTVINNGRSGFCECAAGGTAARSDCEHPPFTCESECLAAGYEGEKGGEEGDKGEAAAAAEAPAGDATADAAAYDSTAEAPPPQDAAAYDSTAEAPPPQDTATAQEGAMADEPPAADDAPEYDEGEEYGEHYPDHGMGDDYQTEDDYHKDEADDYEYKKYDDEPPEVDGFTPDPGACPLTKSARATRSRMRACNCAPRDARARAGRGRLQRAGCAGSRRGLGSWPWALRRGRGVKGALTAPSPLPNRLQAVKTRRRTSARTAAASARAWCRPPWPSSPMSSGAGSSTR